MIEYKRDIPLDAADIARVFNRSGIRCPTQDLPRIARMFANSNLVISAWADGMLIGVCRALTDFSYSCYLSDLAVDAQFQHHGIGKAMVQQIQAIIGDEVALLLLSTPNAMDYYPKLGFAKADNAFLIKRKN